MQYQFLFPWTQLLREMGYEVHIGCNFKEGNNCSEERIREFQAELDALGIPYFQIDFARNGLKLWTYRKPISQMMALSRKYGYAAIHCQTPVGGVCGRFVARKTKAKAIYTAHGFHFFKGAPLFNWLVYYPVERFLSRWTDTLITINREDFSRARKFHAAHTYQISGAGVNLERYRHSSRTRKEVLSELGIPEPCTVFLSIGETNRNKNHSVLIRALASLQRPDIHLVIAGTGRMTEKHEKLAADLGIKLQVHFLGFRKDVPELLHAADVFCFPSRREGLGFTAIEAMAAGLPLITSNRHGILDYSVDGVTGYLRHPDDVKGFAEAMRMLANDTMKRKAMGKYNQDAAKRFAQEKVLAEMQEIYEETLGTEKKVPITVQ